MSSLPGRRDRTASIRSGARECCPPRGGDVLAEDMFRLLHRGQPIERGPDPGYWKDFPSHRRKFMAQRPSARSTRSVPSIRLP